MLFELNTYKDGPIASFTPMPKRKPRNLGSIYTPPEFARPLIEWGVSDKNDKVVDLGLGEGVFTFLAVERLTALGASPKAACSQIYSNEIDAPTYEKFLLLSDQQNLSFPNIYLDNLMTRDLPQVNTVTGNPPYVRRTAISDFESIYEVTEVDNPTVSRLSDLYIYFLLRAMSKLCPGGRLAVITADTWLNVRYGEAFKKALKDNFNIESLISFDRAVFPNAQVKPVLLFAKKKVDRLSRKNIWFIRAQNGLVPNQLLPLVKRQSTVVKNTLVVKVKPQHLQPSDTWSRYFQQQALLQTLVSHPLMTRFQTQFKSRIGIQTLANDFFVLSEKQITDLQIEQTYLRPFAHSSQSYRRPVIEASTKATHFLFYCSRYKNALHGTKALKYIQAGEKKVVPVRGKDATVVGYHNKDRIKRDRRPRWYDLQTRLDTRSAAVVLLPRVFSRNFQVSRNDAGVLAGEPFIECAPKDELAGDLDLSLALLSNSIFEIFVRVSSQLYGGGACTVSPERLKDTRILNAAELGEQPKSLLRDAYRTYISNDKHDRSIIDTAMYDILELSTTDRKQVSEILKTLVVISTTANTKPTFE